MERVLSPEEKIRRAEEIYQRRRSQYGTRTTVAKVNVNEEKDFSLFKKMILQIAICLVIYFIFYLLQNGNYIFSQNVLQKAKEILEYDINVSEVCSKVSQYIQEQFQGLVPDTQEEPKESEENPVNEVRK